ncbi:hypothetical protein B0F90DRAFT_745563 [Multifurca ochricompacta]|uniref:Uncharacterized protein n=1 Tax=Multifurca ochricompacta TaxID=376703 RepID=A0AAD4QRL9_9AGAM|nr:hypothetical protein B0F90DRAFT_745563 [Multifurca ochricompacta]
MAVKLEINPLSPSLDLLGPPDQSSAYSLSGHISISLTSSHSLFERRHAIRILLQSLVVTFEGQAELVTQETGYSALRLCSISKELVPKTTVELTNEGHEDGDRPCTWHVMFDLPIPGWLPASDLYGDCRQGYSGTQYNLYASMKFTNSEESCGPSWLSALCTQFSSKNKIVYAEACRITLNRFALPPRSVSYPPTFYSITPNGEAPRPEGNPYPIPADIVSKIELFASIPEHVNVDEDKFPFTLIVSGTTANREIQCLCECVCGVLSSPFLKDQPPNRPLRGAHPVHALYEIGLLARPNHLTLDDVHSLLPGYKRVDVPLNRADHARKCAEGLHPTRWFTMEALIPFTQTLTERKHENLEWAGTPRLRVTSRGPFFNVKHSMRVVVALSYDDADGNLQPPPFCPLASLLNSFASVAWRAPFPRFPSRFPSVYLRPILP